MTPKCVIVLFASLFFVGECVHEDAVPSVEVPPTLPTTTDVLAEAAVNVPGKGEKLEQEIDRIGKDMQPDTGVVQEDLRIHDEFDLREKLENFTTPKLKTTEKSVKEQDQPIDGDGLEQEEAAPDPEDDGEQLRPPGENDFGEFNDLSRNRKDPEHRVEEEARGAQNTEPPERAAIKETPVKSDPVQQNDSTISPGNYEVNQEEHLAVKSGMPRVPETELTGIATKVQMESISETRYPGKANNSEKETVVFGPPRPPPVIKEAEKPISESLTEIRGPPGVISTPDSEGPQFPSTSDRESPEFQVQHHRERPEHSEKRFPGIREPQENPQTPETRYFGKMEESETEPVAIGLPRPPPRVVLEETRKQGNLDSGSSELEDVTVPSGIKSARFHSSDLGVKSDKLEIELSGIQEVGLPGIPSTSSVRATGTPDEKPYVPDIGFTGVSDKPKQEISETRYPGKPEATEEEPVGPTRPPPRTVAKTTEKPEKPEDVYRGPPGISSSTSDAEGPRIPSREGPEFQDPDRRKSEISSADIRGVDHPDIPIRPTDEFPAAPKRPEDLNVPDEEPEKLIPKVVDGIHDPRSLDKEKEDKREKEAMRRPEIIEAEEEEEEEEDWIKWDLVHFLLLLSPYDEEEVTWWTIIFEAVKCSLRSCPNAKPHWHLKKTELPRVNRHRRQDSDFYPEAIPTPPKTKPCACQNLENYFEQLYESIGDKKKEKARSSGNNSTVVNN